MYCAMSVKGRCRLSCSPSVKVNTLGACSVQKLMILSLTMGDGIGMIRSKSESLFIRPGEENGRIDSREVKIINRASEWVSLDPSRGVTNVDWKNNNNIKLKVQPQKGNKCPLAAPRSYLRLLLFFIYSGLLLLFHLSPHSFISLVWLTTATRTT